MGLCSAYSEERLRLLSGVGSEPHLDFTWLTVNNSHRTENREEGAFEASLRLCKREIKCMAQEMMRHCKDDRDRKESVSSVVPHTEICWKEPEVKRHYLKVIQSGFCHQKYSKKIIFL